MPLLDVLIPAEVGDVEECVVVTWLKKAGDTVKEGEDLLILQAEKISFDVPAPASGTVTAILVKQGEVAIKEQPLAQLEVSKAQVQPPPPAPQPDPEASAPAREHDIDLSQISGSGGEGRITEKDVQAVVETKQAKAAPPAAPAREVRASPIAKRLSREYDLDLAQVAGSGSEGRVTEQDVRAYLAAQKPVPPSPEAQPPAEKTIRLAGMRGAIAQRMHQSLQQMAQLTLHTETDVTGLVALREELKQTWPVTYTDLLIKACALALRQHPRLNATLEGESIKLLPDVHVGLAVALDEGLVVPVVHNADQKSLAEIARERARLVDRARANQLISAEISGGTFTITNLGAYDVVAFTPIVNPPEVAILGVGRIVDKVVVYQGKVAQRSMMTLSLSFDHRLVDGAPAAAFLQQISRLLQEPGGLK